MQLYIRDIRSKQHLNSVFGWGEVCTSYIRQIQLGTLIVQVNTLFIYLFIPRSENILKQIVGKHC